MRNVTQRFSGEQKYTTYYEPRPAQLVTSRHMTLKTARCGCVKSTNEIACSS